MRVNIAFLLALLSALVVTAAAPSARAASSDGVRVGRVQVCEGTPASGRHCRIEPLAAVDPQGRDLWLTAPVRLPPRSSPQAMGVFVNALAASAAWWDGRPIGRNGRPSADPAREQAGLRDAVFLLPAEAATPGVHLLTLRMSSGLSPVRFATPIGEVAVRPYRGPLEPALRAYLPALMSAGLLLAGAVWSGLPVLRGRRSDGGGWLALAALLAMAQLAVETSRAFFSYPYPEHIWRVGLLLVLAAGLGAALLAYALARFACPWRRRAWAAQGALALAVALAVPGFDQKTSGEIAAAAALCALVAADAARRKAPGGWTALTAFGLCALAAAIDPGRFLDRNLYLWFTGLFLILFLDGTRRSPPKAEPSAPVEPARLPLGSASERRFVMPSEIVRLAAADDYTEVFLACGRPLLHPEPLGRLLQRLPGSFVRVHRSHAVNLDHVDAFRRGPRSSVTLSDGAVAPVSRRLKPALADALEGALRHS